MYNAGPARNGPETQTLLPDLAPLDWSGRESNGNFMGKAWVMGLEKRVPAVELMAVVVTSNIPPFVSLAQATSETLFYRNVRLKRTRLAQPSSFVKHQFDRSHFSPIRKDTAVQHVLYSPGVSFSFFLSEQYFAGVASKAKSVTQLRLPQEKQQKWTEVSSRPFYHLFQCSWCTFAQTWTRFRSVPLWRQKKKVTNKWMEKWASLKANTHNNGQLDKQTAGVLWVSSDEETYFRPACVLGNDKSGMQKENEGCQINTKSSTGCISLAKTQRS